MSDPKYIWLAPDCRGNLPAGHGESGPRQWCEDDVWGECEECGAKPVRYVITGSADELAEAREALRLSVIAMRAPLDDWKGMLERKALDASRALLKEST